MPAFAQMELATAQDYAGDAFRLFKLEFQEYWYLYLLKWTALLSQVIPLVLAFQLIRHRQKSAASNGVPKSSIAIVIIQFAVSTAVFLSLFAWGYMSFLKGLVAGPAKSAMISINLHQLSVPLAIQSATTAASLILFAIGGKSVRILIPAAVVLMIFLVLVFLYLFFCNMATGVWMPDNPKLLFDLIFTI